MGPKKLGLHGTFKPSTFVVFAMSLKSCCPVTFLILGCTNKRLCDNSGLQSWSFSKQQEANVMINKKTLKKLAN